MEELDNFKRFLAEEDKKIELRENDMDGPVQHHIEQIEDDLSYGEFGTVEEVVGFLDAIIAGIERVKAAQIEIFDEEGGEPDFMDPDFNPNEDGFDEDREYDDEFSSKKYDDEEFEGNSPGFS